MNVRATFAALLMAAAPISRADAQFDFTISTSNHTQFGALVTVDLRNTQPSNSTMLQYVSEFRLVTNALGGSACFVTGPCMWGPKSIGIVGPVGLNPFQDAQGNTFTQSLSGWEVDLAFAQALGFGNGADNLGVLGCINPRYIANAWGTFYHYTARTCAAEGQSGFVRFQTFLTVQNEFGHGVDPSILRSDLFEVSYAVKTLPLITPEPATWTLMAGGIGVLGVIARRKRTPS